MGGQKSEPTQTEPNQPQASQPTQTNRQIGCIASLHIHLHLHISLSLCLSICLFFACASVQERNDHYTLIQALPSPPPIQERGNLGSLSSIFFLNFFWGNFFLQNFTRFFFWLWVFLREYIFWFKHFDRERFFFFARVVFSEIVQF